MTAKHESHGHSHAHAAPEHKTAPAPHVEPVKAATPSTILPFPTAFPSDAIGDAIAIVTSGQVGTLLADLARDLWVVQGYLEGTLIPTGAGNANAIPTAHKDALTEFARVVAQARAKIQAHKLGDGQLLQTILKMLPTILGLLKLFGVPVPTLPTA